MPRLYNKKQNIMKKLKFFAFALAASAVAFTLTSCSDDDPVVVPPPPPPPTIHILGEATEFDEPTIYSMFFAGRNEANNNALDPRIHEMYAWLEAGTFYIAVLEGAETARTFGGTPANFTYHGQDDREFVGGRNGAWGGRFYRPENEGTFTITEAGLHHIVYFQGDENLDPIVMIAKIDYMGLRGGLNSGSFSPFVATRVADGVDFERIGFFRNDNWFKLAYNAGWKIPLAPFNETAWNTDNFPNVPVVVNTNFGGAINDLVVGAGDLRTAGLEDGNFRLSLAWRSNREGHGFTLAIERLGEFFAPAEDWEVRLRGNNIVGDGWQNTEAATLTTSEPGRAVFTMENLELASGGYFGFPIFVDGAELRWFSPVSEPVAMEVTGDTDYLGLLNEDGTPRGTVLVTETRTYNITFTFEFNADEAAFTSATAHFELVTTP